MLSKVDPALGRLLASADPAVEMLARRDLLGEPVPADACLSSPVVRGLLSGLHGAVADPYRKWTGAHWRLVSLIELGVPPGHDVAVAAADAVLDHWAREDRLGAVPVIDGRARRCASQEGNAVAVACRLGMAGDDRVRVLVEHLLAWQWPDGGWNCDKRRDARRSSFHETLPALWGLHEYGAATGSGSCRDAVHAGAELLLEHEVVFATRTAEPIHPSFLRLSYPTYWHYGILQALLVLDRAGYGADQRTGRARGLVAARRRPDGMWRAGPRWWRPPGVERRNVEAVDWGVVADEMTTLNALRVGAAESWQDLSET